MIMVMNCAGRHHGRRLGRDPGRHGCGARRSGCVAGLVNGLLITAGADRGLHRHARHDGHLPLAGHLARRWRHAVARLCASREVYRPVYYDGLLRRRLADHRLRRSSPSSARSSCAAPPSAATARPSAPTSRWRAIRPIKVDRVRLMTYVLQGILRRRRDASSMCRASARPRARRACCGNSKPSPAVIIGGTMLKGGFGRVWGTVVGVADPRPDRQHPQSRRASSAPISTGRSRA